METGRTLGPEDLDLSGSVEKGTNNARVRDYIHAQGKAVLCHCQNLKSGVTHARLRESCSVLPLSRDALFELGFVPMVVNLNPLTRGHWSLN